MPRKKKEDEVVDQAQADGTANPDEANGTTDAATADGDAGDSPSILGSVVDTATSVLGSVVTTIGEGAATVASAVAGLAGGTEDTKPKGGKRAERVGIVASDKMTKTVTVRVDRMVKHPTYRKYVKRRKKFMAHDELGARIGDKVRIIETRPLSARKRWRVVEILQRAEL
jgi:small subunit ribosomal protein S17